MRTSTRWRANRTRKYPFICGGMMMMMKISSNFKRTHSGYTHSLLQWIWECVCVCVCGGGGWEWEMKWSVSVSVSQWLHVWVTANKSLHYKRMDAQGAYVQAQHHGIYASKTKKTGFSSLARSKSTRRQNTKRKSKRNPSEWNGFEKLNPCTRFLDSLTHMHVDARALSSFRWEVWKFE